MSTVYRPVPTPAKWQEIEDILTGYWEKNRWVITDTIFDEFRLKDGLPIIKLLTFPVCNQASRKRLSFSLYAVSGNTRYDYTRYLMLTEHFLAFCPNF